MAFVLNESQQITMDDRFLNLDERTKKFVLNSSFKSQPFSDRTFSRFRERLYLYYLETGRDLLHCPLREKCGSKLQKKINNSKNNTKSQLTKENVIRRIQHTSKET